MKWRAESLHHSQNAREENGHVSKMVKYQQETLEKINMKAKGDKRCCL